MQYWRIFLIFGQILPSIAPLLGPLSDQSQTIYTNMNALVIILVRIGPDFSSKCWKYMNFPYTCISSHGHQNLVSEFFSEPVLFYFNIDSADAHILSKSCSSTQLETASGQNMINNIKHVGRMLTFCCTQNLVSHIFAGK